MYITQDIAMRIKAMAKTKRITQKEMLSQCGININAITDFAKGKQLSCISLAKIADYLDCSVDYLLGRTGNPQVNSSNNITTGDIQGDNNANINIGSTQKNDDIQEIIGMLQELSLIQRSELVVMINKMKSKK